MKSYRYEKRREKRKSLLLNVAIVIVMVLIAFFALQIFNQEGTVLVDEDEQDPIESEENEEDIESKVPIIEDPITTVPDHELPIDEDPIEEDIIEEGMEDEDEDEPSRPNEGEWEPIGTTQSELRLEFSEGSVNRQEMDRALSYASGLRLEEMTVWRIENAGDQRSVRGVVSNYENSETPYEIYLEWQDGEGWLPVQMNQLDRNPYLQN
ncbi:YrrS family protein [Bacillus sp. JCM 19034]|uniref:YrrS family protein n=1 Tax=Bacillus sp. JCM 19034 TaxID=1481928 RepID=UPI000785F739|nr:YrrS family protein [Bacillus sp. JCM 19034]